MRASPSYDGRRDDLLAGWAAPAYHAEGTEFMKYLASILAIVSMLVVTVAGATTPASAKDKGPGTDTTNAPVAYACGAPDSATDNTARCFAQMRTDISGPLGLAPLAPSGLGPADLRAAYKLTSNGS